mmetsp:Transcript_97630/g.276696  ORF Transcript_97630/g.276696 Transcript_97630/m.276696 type:complete len:326 (-) Transcript_97630:48-1025(-)
MGAERQDQPAAVHPAPDRGPAAAGPRGRDPRGRTRHPLVGAPAVPPELVYLHPRRVLLPRAPAEGGGGQGEGSESPDADDPVALQQVALKRHDPLFELVGAEITSRQVLEENLLQLRKLMRDGDLDVNIRGADGNSPLMLATIRGHLDYCVVLIEAGAETSMPVLSSPNGRLAGLARWGPAKALIEALTVGHTAGSGGDLHMAMEKLQPEVKIVASLLIRRAKAKALDSAEEELQPRDHGDRNGDPRQRGMPYKVVYKEVPVFERPTNGGEDEITCQEGGDIVEVYEYDRTRNWGRVRVDGPDGEEIWGWMPLQSDVLGELLVPL